MIASIVIDLIRDAINPDYELHNGLTAEVFTEKHATELGWDDLDAYFTKRWTFIRPRQRLECKLVCFYYNKGVINFQLRSVFHMGAHARRGCEGGSGTPLARDGWVAGHGERHPGRPAQLNIADPEFQQKLRVIVDTAWFEELKLRPMGEPEIENDNSTLSSCRTPFIGPQIHIVTDKWRESA